MIQVTCTKCPINTNNTKPRRIRNHRKAQSTISSLTLILTFSKSTSQDESKQTDYSTTTIATENYYSYLDDNDSITESDTMSNSTMSLNNKMGIDQTHDNGPNQDSKHV